MSSDKKEENLEIVSDDTKSKVEVNTYDSPLTDSEYFCKSGKSSKHKHNFIKSFHVFMAITMIFLAIIFASSEIFNFLVNDMGAGNIIFNRIFGNNHSFGKPDNFYELILKQNFIDPSGNKDIKNETETQSETYVPDETETHKETEAETKIPIIKPEETDYLPEETDYSPKENQHPIINMDLSLISLGNNYIFNSTKHSIDPEKIRNMELDNYYRDDLPLVLIIHTHATESFMPIGAKYYTESVEIARSSNSNENMIAVGEAFTEVLEANGIKTIHCTVMHDAESYRESYSRASESIKRYLKAYPSIKYIFDLHRDSIMRSDNSLVSAVTCIDGENYSQVMPVVGTNYEGWESNLSFALKLRENLNDKYANICRPVCLRESTYNHNLAENSLLIEIGSSGNNIEQAKRSATLVALCISDMIKK